MKIIGLQNTLIDLVSINLDSLKEGRLLIHIDVLKNWTLQMLIPQYLVLVLKLSPIYTATFNTVFLIPQNQCYPGTPCIVNTDMSYDTETEINKWRQSKNKTNQRNTIQNKKEML